MLCSSARLGWPCLGFEHACCSKQCLRSHELDCGGRPSAMINLRAKISLGAKIRYMQR